MDILEFYSLLKNIENLDNDWLENFTKRVHNKFNTHKICHDYELVLLIHDCDILNKSEIICDFQGWTTGFSTKIIFIYEEEQLIELKLLEDENDIEKVFKLYSIEELRNPIF
jgi:hypothetical protein